ncbi:unnamed protein product [Dibothriocephalus latus]|uniref:Uncharacterized protein n=1 Tax=Dibothriocephalus latus TaxID=60516 RepID=A0A3P7NQ54_DIBLA|nr:unnamed protein product [Dibothriocephalus latus]
MLAVFIPERNRHPRLFRAKYTEELNLDTLEDCLVSAANKVFDLSAGDRSLKPARPSAKAFLDILARVQAVVSEAMITAPTTVRSRQRKNSRRSPALRSAFCQTSFFRPAVSPSEELGMLSRFAFCEEEENVLDQYLIDSKWSAALACSLKPYDICDIGA